MSPLAVAVLAFSMSIDAFIAALSRGAATQGATFGAALRTGMVFGAVETLTPIAGWALGVAAGRYVAAVDHWIAFGLLAAVGGRMIFHAVTRSDETPPPRPRGAAITVLLATAVGSSLDAMAVGVCIGGVLQVALQIPSLLKIGMLPRLARAGYSEELLQVVRNPATAFTAERVRAEQNTYLVYVGRLEEDKGALDLARAAKRVGAELVCVGDGVLRERLERDFPEIRITGWLTKPAMIRWVSGARALVMPSHHPEPFALVLAEAAASGLPVAVAKTALMAEEIAAAGLGLSFDVFDREDFDRTLRAFLDMGKAALQEMSRRGFEGAVRLAQEEDAWITQLAGLYAAALSGNTGEPARVTG